MRTLRVLRPWMVALLLAAPLAAVPSTYRVVDLGQTTGSVATGVNGSWHATGLYFPPGGERRAFVWKRGLLTDAGTLGGLAQTFAINDQRVAVGYSVDSTGRQRAITSLDGTVTALGTLHGGVHANANDINNGGWIVGMSQRKVGNQQFSRAALWRNGSVVDLGTFGGEYAEAFGLNDAGEVVGWAWNVDRRMRAFRWSPGGGLLDLGTLGGLNALATEINPSGTIVGTSDIASGSSVQRGFVWTAALGMQELPSPASVQATAATAVNGAGQIVGVAYFPPDVSARGLLWEGGQVYFLDELLEPGSEWTVIQATDISERGRIAAAARPPGGNYRAVLLVPVH